jgi:hypothetical protein
MPIFKIHKLIKSNNYSAFDVRGNIVSCRTKCIKKPRSCSTSGVSDNTERNGVIHKEVI